MLSPPRLSQLTLEKHFLVGLAHRALRLLLQPLVDAKRVEFVQASQGFDHLTPKHVIHANLARVFLFSLRELRQLRYLLLRQPELRLLPDPKLL